MSYYDILGISESSTPDEIKAAYRNLVRQYHPDINKSAEASQLIVQINEAYDILSDPEKRKQYDHGYFRYATIPEEEDPREVERRNYMRRKREEERRKNELTTKWRKRVFSIFRWVSFPILLFALLLILDDWLPSRVFNEVAELGWQERRGGHYHRGRVTKGDLFSFMKTKTFEFVVPDEIHLNYDYNGSPDTLAISTTPIFKVIQAISIADEDMILTWSDYHGIAGFIPWPYLLLVSATFSALRKKYSYIAFSLCFMPVLLLALTIIYYLW